MPSGLPDWSQVKTALDFQFSNDIGELAARLGSPVRFYRSGNVLVFSSFESGDDYFEHFAAGGTNTAIESTDQALSGAQSLKMVADSAGTVCQSYKRLPYHAEGISAISFAIDVTFLTNSFSLWLTFTKDSAYKIALLDLNKGLNVFRVAVAANTYETVAPFPTKSAPGQHQWMGVKLFVDTINWKYYALNVNNTLYDLTAYPLFASSNNVRDNVMILLNLATPSASIDTIYLDNLVYTINDPS